MAETEYSQKNLAEMLTRLGNVEAMLRFSVGSSAESKRRIEDAFADREGAPEMYLLFAEGPLTQVQIEQRTGQSKANVSRICSHLVRHGLLAKDPNPSGPGFVWRWSDMEDLLNASKIARQSARGTKKGSSGVSNASA